MKKKITMPFRIITKEWNKTNKVYYNMPDKNNYEISRTRVLELIKKSGFKKNSKPFAVDIQYHIKGQKPLTMEEFSWFFIKLFRGFMMKQSQLRGLNIQLIQGAKDWKVDLTISA